MRPRCLDRSAHSGARVETRSDLSGWALRIGEPRAVAMSIHLSGGGATPRRVVLSCDVAGCPIQVEPSAAERWRSDADAGSWARDHALGWTHDPVRRTDYCPEHAAFSTPPAPGAVAPRPSATVRDRAGNPVNRDDYAAQLRAQLAEAYQATGSPAVLTRAQADVAARLLDELAGVYTGEELGRLAGELSQMLDSQVGEQD
jgi:hypothetical protein